MTTPIASAVCGPYEILAQREGSLLKHPDHSLELQAEACYLVRLGDGADPHALRGALTIPHGGTEGILQFGNFVGQASLGGRKLAVRSRRLATTAVELMLDDVAGHLASLPFFAATPTSAPYVRDRSMSSDALYHTYVFLRDSMRGGGQHDLPGAVERIIARPHETLRSEDAQLIPLGRASQIDAATVAAISSEPELLSPLAEGSPLATHPLARRLRGRMPEFIRTRPLRHTTNNPENRFVAAALDAMSDIARQFELLAIGDRRVASATNSKEASAIAATLSRWRRHPMLEPLSTARDVPIRSTVLRGRAGYRQLLRCYIELMARTRLSEPSDMRALLELRDAALMYEYWCYFRVVDGVADSLRTAAQVDRFAVDAVGSRVPYGYRAKVGHATILYNETYSRPASGSPEIGQHSYSVRLRPDITLRSRDGGLHLFDAKLKLDFGQAVDADDHDDAKGRPDTFNREDLYKMHAYRDALGADSVWVLYPGSDPSPTQYRLPWDDRPLRGDFHGVGAIALRPGADHDGGLKDRIFQITGRSGAD